MPDTIPVRWQPNRRPERGLWPIPGMAAALRRGALGACPVCGKTRLFAGWLRVAKICAVCDAPLGEVRADDAPPYFTIFIVAHVVIGSQIVLERFASLSVGTEMLIFLPGTLALTLALMRPVKGATVGLMLSLGMAKPPDHG